MKRITMLLLLSTLLHAVVAAQSLGEAARAARKNKQPAQTARKVYTNENLPIGAALSIMGPPPAPEVPASSLPADDKTAGKPAPPAKPLYDMTPEERKKAEEEWRTRFADQRKKIGEIERELDLLRRENQVQWSGYYADLGSKLRDESKWAETQAKMRKDLESKEKDLQAARARLDELRDELRRAGFSSSLAD